MPFDYYIRDYFLLSMHLYNYIQSTSNSLSLENWWGNIKMILHLTPFLYMEMAFVIKTVKGLSLEQYRNNWYICDEKIKKSTYTLYNWPTISWHFVQVVEFLTYMNHVFEISYIKFRYNIYTFFVICYGRALHHTALVILWYQFIYKACFETNIMSYISYILSYFHAICIYSIHWHK